jgi:hypothetical protein
VSEAASPCCRADHVCLRQTTDIAVCVPTNEADHLVAVEHWPGDVLECPPVEASVTLSSLIDSAEKRVMSKLRPVLGRFKVLLSRPPQFYHTGFMWARTCECCWLSGAPISSEHRSSRTHSDQSLLTRTRANHCVEWEPMCLQMARRSLLQYGSDGNSGAYGYSGREVCTPTNLLFARQACLRHDRHAVSTCVGANVQPMFAV